MCALSKVQHLHREPCQPRVRRALLDRAHRDDDDRCRAEVQPRCRLRRPRQQRGVQVVEPRDLARERPGAAEEDAEDVEVEGVHDGDDVARE